ncbi:hypothetical protein ACFV7R_37870 [Streptomyces sp. NPDC059866]|uniref:hypothetical protein n=1 Tax=Streptomyces sp. NPDC059866 TaxID=3346978 RepID=UPI00365612BE
MDRPSRAPRRRPASDPVPGPYAQLTGGGWCRPLIYAQLVAQWRAEGRCVPARPEVQWVSFAALPARACGAERRS